MRDGGGHGRWVGDERGKGRKGSGMITVSPMSTVKLSAPVTCLYLGAGKSFVNYQVKRPTDSR